MLWELYSSWEQDLTIEENNSINKLLNNFIKSMYEYLKQYLHLMLINLRLYSHKYLIQIVFEEKNIIF